MVDRVPRLWLELMLRQSQWDADNARLMEVRAYSHPDVLTPRRPKTTQEPPSTTGMRIHQLQGCASTVSEITQLEHALSLMAEDPTAGRTVLEHRLQKARKKVEGVPVPAKPVTLAMHFTGPETKNHRGLEISLASQVIRLVSAFIVATISNTLGRPPDAAAGPLLTSIDSPPPAMTFELGRRDPGNTNNLERVAAEASRNPKRGPGPSRPGSSGNCWKS